MPVEIRQIRADEYHLYNSIKIDFQVESEYRVDEIDGGLGGFRLIEVKTPKPYTKDYDNGGHPIPGWSQQFDISDWVLFLAVDQNRPVGGAALAVNTEVYPLDNFQREDMIVLWDIRVDPDSRQKGIGAALFNHVSDWARGKGYGQLGLETQNINVPACRFYSKMGCRLGAIHRYGYIGCPEVAHEVMLLWYYDL